jgi:hypothetical protein
MAELRRPAKAGASSPPPNGQIAGADRILAGPEVGGDALSGHEKGSHGRPRNTIAKEENCMVE